MSYSNPSWGYKLWLAVTAALLMASLAANALLWMQWSKASERNTATIALASRLAENRLRVTTLYLDQVEEGQESSRSLDLARRSLWEANMHLEYIAIVDRERWASWRFINQGMNEMLIALQETGVSLAQEGSLGEADLESIREIRGLADTVKLALPHVERRREGGAAEVGFDNEAIVAAEESVRTYMLALRGH